jgi:hypothetical protein
MTFQSILFGREDDDSGAEVLQPPAFFRDLHLDQIVEAITADSKLRPSLQILLEGGRSVIAWTILEAARKIPREVCSKKRRITGNTIDL